MDVAELDRRLSLAAAVVRFDELRTRDSLADRDGGPSPLTRPRRAQHGSVGDVGFDAADAAAARAVAGSPDER
jgi:hypothetical protein